MFLQIWTFFKFFFPQKKIFILWLQRSQSQLVSLPRQPTFDPWKSFWIGFWRQIIENVSFAGKEPGGEEISHKVLGGGPTRLEISLEKDFFCGEVQSWSYVCIVELCQLQYYCYPRPCWKKTSLNFMICYIWLGLTSEAVCQTVVTDNFVPLQ